MNVEEHLHARYWLKHVSTLTLAFLRLAALSHLRRCLQSCIARKAVELLPNDPIIHHNMAVTLQVSLQLLELFKHGLVTGITYAHPNKDSGNVMIAEW